MSATFSRTSQLRAARALGYASFGIAALEAFAPRFVADLLGLREDHPGLLKALAAREAAAGATILSQPRDEATPTLAAGLWSRVLGDAMDLALLAGAFRTTRRPVALGLTTAMVAGITAMDFKTAKDISAMA